MGTLAHYEISGTEAQRRLRAGGIERKERSRNLMESERVSIGIEAKFKKAADVAADWGISPSTVYQISGGFIQTAAQRAAGGAAENAVDTKLVEAIGSEIEKTKNQIVKSATSKLLKAMEGLTDEKLAGGKLRELSSVARDMATVVEKTEGKGMGGSVGVNVQIYAPSLINASEIPTINVIPEKN